MTSRKPKSDETPEQPIDSTASTEKPVFRTARAERLWAIRQRAIAGGLRLLSGDEIEREILRRRGELAE